MLPRFLLVSIISLHTLCCLHGQTPFVPSQVERSQEIILYQGKKFYLHSVQSGHTLYSICKAYNTTQNELMAANPGIDLQTLSIGQALKIPVASPASLAAPAPAPAYEAQNGMIQHVVKAKETPYSLSKLYQVPVDHIYQFNPEARQGIRIGQIVLIPSSGASATSAGSVQEPVGSPMYEVKQGDTLYQIALSQGVSINQLFQANPDLRWGLKTGQRLVIPSHDPTTWIAHPSRPDSIYSVFAHNGLTRYQCDSIAALKHMRPPVKVALLLPFFTQESLHPDTTSVSVDSTDLRSHQKGRGLKGRVAAEFYEGVLLALDSLSQQGMDISLFVFDTQADTNQVKAILKKLEIVEPHLIIGPLAANNIKLVSRFSFEHKIPFIPPLAESEAPLKDNPNLFRIIPTDRAAYSAYTQYIASRLDSSGIVLVYQDNEQNRDLADSIKTLLINQADQRFAHRPKFIRTVTITDRLQRALDTSLTNGAANKVLVLSDYEPDVINVMSQLHFLLRDHKIEVFGFSSWQKFDNVRIDVMHELQTTLYSPFYIDYQNKAVERFVAHCRTQLKTEPYQTSGKGTGINYTYLGYDMAMYFIPAVNRYESNACKCIRQYKNPQLLSPYQFNRNPESGILENESISILKYTKEYEVVKVN